MLRKERQRLGYSQEYVAMELGISQKAYSDLENRKTKLKEDTLRKLSEVFNVMPSKICSLNKECHCINDTKFKNKYLNLIQYLYNNKINIPDDLL
jgi:transcriptional regulator with XRE-family HTH domain